MRNPKKVKKRRVTTIDDGVKRTTLNPSIKNKGGLYVRVIKKKAKENLLLAYKIQEAEANS